MLDTKNLSDKQGVDVFRSSIDSLHQELSKKIIGQTDVIRQVLISIFCKGHCLLVGVPGLAKTLLVHSISESLGLRFNRIQFTPDLMPSDITGTEILNEEKKFNFIKGPVFTNILLADEINRTPPKTQAALLEAMQEKSVTVNGLNYKLDEPFFVLATQNPIEQEGTYPLPEAQLDRFMFNIWVDYPSTQEEIQIVKNTTSDHQAQINHILDQKTILYFQDLVRKIPITDNVVKYAVELVGKTRPKSALSTDFTNKYISWGAGPRASQFLILGAKCNAIFNGKYAPDIEDVKAVALPILRHRVVKNYQSEADGVSIENLIQELL